MKSFTAIWESEDFDNPGFRCLMIHTNVFIDGRLEPRMRFRSRHYMCNIGRQFEKGDAEVAYFQNNTTESLSQRHARRSSR